MVYGGFVGCVTINGSDMRFLAIVFKVAKNHAITQIMVRAVERVSYS